MSILSRLRRLWLDVHLWIGAGLLIALIPLSVTGGILVWHEEIDRSLYAERYAVSGPEVSQPLAAYAAAAQGIFSGKATLAQVRLPQKRGEPVVATGRLAAPPGPGGRPRTLTAWIDPPTGRVLSVAEVGASVTQVMHRLHGTLLIPEIGRKVVGWLGWAMTISSLTGLWLWWPRHGGVLKGLRWRRGSSQLFNLHHLVGFWVSLPLAILSLTGVYISFPQTSHALLGAPPPPARNAARNAPPLTAPGLSVTEAVAAAQAKAPGAQVASVSTPTASDEPAWRVEFKGKGPVRVIDATGEAKAPRGQAGQAGGDPLSRWMRQVHDGNDTGPIWRGIITLAGLAPAVLGVTGVIMWLRRRRRRRAISAAA